jgi:ankyrin repeat protein
MSQAQPALSQELINEFVVSSHFDLDKIKSMLAENPSLLNENAEWIETPLQAAAHVGRRDIAEFLLAKGAPLDICTAAMLGRGDDVKSMLADDPSLYEAVGAHNIPVIYYAVIGGHKDIAETLLAAGAVINIDDGGNSPLHGAAMFGQLDMAKWLLDHDANPYTTDFEGKTPLERAEMRGHEAIAALLRPFFPNDQ